MRDQFSSENVDKHKGKIAGVVAGFILGLLLVNYGIIKTLFIVVCMIIGIMLGRRWDNDERNSILEYLDKMLPPEHH